MRRGPVVVEDTLRLRKTVLLETMRPSTANGNGNTLTRTDLFLFWEEGRGAAEWEILQVGLHHHHLRKKKNTVFDVLEPNLNFFFSMIISGDQTGRTERDFRVFFVFFFWWTKCWRPTCRNWGPLKCCVHQRRSRELERGDFRSPDVESETKASVDRETVVRLYRTCMAMLL